MDTKIQSQSIEQLRAQRPVTAAINPDAMLRIHQIIGDHDTPPLLPIGRTSFYRLIAEGKLPQPRKLGSASLWRASELLAAMGAL
jgi:predicted DNA-binding transcriptional regulator AlpA